MMNANIALNNEKNGIEIRFDKKPEIEIIESLKSKGFRWSGKHKMWYAKQTPERIEFTNSLNSKEAVSSVAKNKIEKHLSYDLWEMTRTDDIVDNYAIYKILDVKEIASIVRKHIKPRFPMCKFSVKSDYNSIDIDLLASPFEKESEELNAIVHYVYTFTQSYNYDNSDSMSDYFDVNFYGVYEKNIISYCYEQTEMTESVKGMIDIFRKKKAEYDEAEAIRKEKELEESIRQAEIDRQIAVEKEKKIEADKKAIEDGVIVSDYENPYYILDLRSPHLNKLCNIDEANREIAKGEYKIEPCEITREVHMSEELYNKFKNMLTCDFSFLASKGGTGTLDNRINEMLDYTKMSKEESETVEFYACDCVAIYCGDDLMLVCNPEGFDYARYILVPAESYTTTNSYSIQQVVSDEELKVNRDAFDMLYDKSTDIIMANNLGEDWNNGKFNEWRKLMTKYIIENGIAFNVNVARAIPEDAMKFKIAMYRMLEETESIRDQFDRAELEDGKKITIIKFDNIIGGIRTEKVIFKCYEHSNWGGKDGIKLVIKKPNRRGEFYQILNDKCLIVDGWMDIPRELFWEEVPSPTGLKCERTRFLSFDEKQFDVVLDFFQSAGIKPIINTYKPQFN